jgi:hypothetical protein
VEVMQGLENAELQRLVLAHTLQAHNRGAFMTKCGPVTATRSGAVRSPANGRSLFTAYATEHCAWIHVGVSE